jgi:hypothetical protein
VAPPVPYDARHSAACRYYVRNRPGLRLVITVKRSCPEFRSVCVLLGGRGDFGAALFEFGSAAGWRDGGKVVEQLGEPV